MKVSLGFTLVGSGLFLVGIYLAFGVAAVLVMGGLLLASVGLVRAE